MADAYDDVAYPGNAFPDTHPDRMATIAQLLGVRAPPVDRCRVLELGCGDGVNLISMAGQLPGSTFVGLDRAEGPIVRGQEMARELGLSNVRLEQMDLMDLAPDFGTFDYIIAHGVFSWVPEPVRLKVLEVCRQQLAPQGVAFISYIALPGAHLRNVFREVMLFHTRGRSDPAERVTQARAMMRMIADMPGTDDYRAFARSLVDELERADDGVIYHDYLADVNAAYYLVQFADLAAQYDLQFLSEAEFPAGFIDVDGAPAHVTSAVRQIEGNVLVREQYYDFFRCRRYRQTLLCRAGVTIERPAQPDRIAGLHVASAIRPATNELDLTAGVIEAFRGAKGGMVRTDQPVAKAALRQLGAAWPSSVAIDDLLEAARAEAGRSVDSLDDDRTALHTILLRCYERGYIELRTQPLVLTRTVTERPQASPLARYQLRSGPMVTNLRHETMVVKDDMATTLLQLLDGARDRGAIIAALTGAVASGKATLVQDDRPISTPAEAALIIAGHLEEKLQDLADNALLLT